jgi:hypothetical protein
MSIFNVTFRTSATIEVDCDDEKDAKEYVECLPFEQLQKIMLRWESLQNISVEVSDVKTISEHHKGY